MLFLILSFIWAAAAMYIGAVSMMATDPCAGQCNWTRINAGQIIVVFGVWVPPVLAGIPAVIATRSGRRAWWLPVCAALGTLILLVVGVGLIVTGVP